jgi:hypothetical protein
MKLLNIKNSNYDKLVEIIHKDIEFLKELQSWLEGNDADWSEKVEKLRIRYEIISGAYFTKSRKKETISNKDIEKWKRENL